LAFKPTGVNAGKISPSPVGAAHIPRHNSTSFTDSLIYTVCHFLSTYNVAVISVTAPVDSIHNAEMSPTELGSAVLG
jgi:hypothetical protein